MKHLKLVFLSAAFLALASIAVNAQKPTPEEVFKKIDANADGHIDLIEFKQHKPPKPPEGKPPVDKEKAFKHIDKNADGKIDLEEWKAKKPMAPKPEEEN